MLLTTCVVVRIFYAHILLNGAYGIVMRGVQKCTCAGASLRSKNYAPLHCIILDTATDPPYNTGNDFIYRDDFAISSDDYAEESGQLDDEGNRLFKNTDSNGRFHSDWCSMIYSRLMLARNLLADDGVIFISIDDNEVGNLRKICDDIYGGESFIAEFPRITKKGGKSTNTYAKNHDYVLAFCKNANAVNIKGIEHNDDGFKFTDEFAPERGPYKLNQTLDYNTLGYINSLDYPKFKQLEYLNLIGPDLTDDEIEYVKGY